MKPFLKVIDGGLSTTVQDLGRAGHQAQGVPVSGALDFANLRLANALVDNPQGQGALEIRMLGPTFEVVADSVRVALTGTDTQIELIGEKSASFEAFRSVAFQKGDRFRIPAVKDSAVCYLAVDGGFSLPEIYGSQSTYVSGGFGGYEGRALKSGDLLPLVQKQARDMPERFCKLPIAYNEREPIRVVLGPQDDYFGDEGLSTFFEGPFFLSADSNRMGVRLNGPEVVHAKDANISSDGVVTGAVQIPGNGLPIILLADHQTTGGYPKIGVVASADIPKIGRKRPGDSLTFTKVSVAEAEAARRALEARLVDSISSIENLESFENQLEYQLMHCNLISGVFAD